MVLISGTIMNDGYIMMVNKGSILLMYGLEWQIL